VFPDSDDSVVFHGVPTFFRASCWEASRGGADGYDLAGLNLAIHLHELLEPADDKDRVAAKFDDLEKLIRLAEECDEDHQVECDEDVLRWFDREFPRCMALVPQRRRRSFLKGIRMAVAEDRMFSS
jgi:hypothetical protein